MPAQNRVMQAAKNGDAPGVAIYAYTQIKTTQK
jgi:hypothetical protein